MTCNLIAHVFVFQAGGIEILSQLLSDMSKTECELLEIVSVFVQITAPWIEDGDHVIKGLVYHLCPIIDSLTRKCVII